MHHDAVSMTWIQRKKFDDMGAHVQLHFISNLLPEGAFSWERGLVPVFGLHFWVTSTTSPWRAIFRWPSCCDILVHHFVPVDFLAVIALPRALARVCGCRTGICLNLRGECKQVHIRLLFMHFCSHTFYWEYLLCYPSFSLWLYILPNLTNEILGARTVLSPAKGRRDEYPLISAVWK